MKMKYETPSAEKISFNYRDQVVAASGGESGGNGNNGSGNSWVQNSFGLGSGICGSGGVVDWLFDFGGICD